MEARLSALVQTGSGAYPASYTTGTGSLPGVKRPGGGADYPPPSKCRGHERVGLHLYSPSRPSWPVIGRTFTFTFYNRERPNMLRVEDRGSEFIRNHSNHLCGATKQVKANHLYFSALNFVLVYQVLGH